MKYAYSASNFAISRAGSNTAFELISHKIPTIFIPLPKGNSRGDQVENAKYFESKNLSLTLPQENLTTATLLAKLNELVTKQNILIENMSKLPNLSTNNKICEILNKC